MNIPHSDSPENSSYSVPNPTSSVEVEALQQSVRSLRSQFQILLIVLLLLSGSLNLFLLRQMKLARSQQNELLRAVTAYESNNAPAMNDLVAKLRDFGRSHADYNAVLSRYISFSQSNTPAVSPVPAATPATKPAPARK